MAILVKRIVKRTYPTNEQTNFAPISFVMELVEWSQLSFALISNRIDAKNCKTE